MFSLLFHTCALTVIHLRHCAAYAQPALLMLTITLYLLLQGDVHSGIVLACAVLFLIFNTMYVYAASRQMLKDRPGMLNLLHAFSWRRELNDFFIFIALGMMLLVLLGVYAVDAINLLLDFANRIALEKIREITGSGTTLVEGGYTVLAFGSRLLSILILIGLLFGWVYLCRAGIRIPAHTEGYHLRREETTALTRGHGFTIFTVSLMIIFAVTGFADILLQEIPATSEKWLPALVWSLVYFIIVTFHLAMWVCLYTELVKQVNYHMSIIGR